MKQLLLPILIILLVIGTGCPKMSAPHTQKSVKSIESTRIPQEIKPQIRSLMLDSNFRLSSVDTVMFTMDNAGATYKIHYIISDNSDLIGEPRLKGVLAYTKSLIGYQPVEEQLFLDFSIASYYCTPGHPNIHRASSRSAARDTTAKYHCQRWNVDVR